MCPELKPKGVHQAERKANQKEAKKEYLFPKELIPDIDNKITNFILLFYSLLLLIDTFYYYYLLIFSSPIITKDKNIHDKYSKKKRRKQY
jgi:hypothetical protein